MKNILDYQREYWINKPMINESFESSIIQDIVSQLNETNKRNKEENMEKGYRYKDTNIKFKSMFGSEWVQWSKITDDMFKKFTNKDKAGVKLAKQMIGNRETTFPGLCICVNNDKDAFPKYVGILISTDWISKYFSLSSNLSINGKDIKSSEVEDLLTDTFYIINFSENNVLSRELQNKRTEQKSGTINLWNTKDSRDFDYDRILQQNQERYRQYVAKVKAEKDLNDGMADKVNEYVQKVLDVVSKFSKNPVKYAKYDYEVGYLIDLINERKTYVRTNRGGGEYHGKNGLLTVYKTYIKNKLSLSSGKSYDFQKKEYDSSKEELEKIFKSIDEKIKVFNEE